MQEQAHCPAWLQEAPLTVWSLKMVSPRVVQCPASTADCNSPAKGTYVISLDVQLRQ